MSEAWTAGTQVLHYRLESEIGEGGMGQIWAAVDTRLGRRVALKAIPPELASDPSRLERLRREARTLATINHPSIVTIFSIEETGDQQFLAMELVQGETLGEAIPERGLPLARFFDIATLLAEALSAAHEQGITHRDLKPENVMVSSGDRIKVLDFGLAKPTASDSLDPAPSLALGHAAVPSATFTLTREGDVVGTLPYMSPEQVQGRSVDHRSDIFSLGIVMYEMVTGQRPFSGDSAAALISSILRDVPSSVTDLRGDLPRHLGRIIRQCMEKAPADRFQSARDVFNQLRDLREEITPRHPSDSSGSGRLGSRPHASSSGVPPEGSQWSSASGSSLSPAAVAMASRTGPTLLLVAIFMVNWLETWAESQIGSTFDVAPRLGQEIAATMHRLEGLLSFQGHDNTNVLAVYGYSVSYFFVLPLLGLSIAIALARRPTLSPYRVLALAVAVTYAVSLPFYLLFPVPERWTYPDSGAVLLSDLWTTRLIEVIRPISGLDNCFPSFHTSLTVVLVAVAFRYGMRLRWCVAALGVTVILATFVLGIHWLPDIVAGIAAGILGIALAVRFERRLALV